MQILLKNEYHNTQVQMTVKALSLNTYLQGKAGYTISVHSAGLLANYYIRLSKHQTRKFLKESCGLKNCHCYEFSISRFKQSIVHFDKHGQLNIKCLDEPIKG